MTHAEAHAEALRRIAHARDTGAEVLDLGDLPMGRLPEELGTLAALRVLALGKVSVRVEDGDLKWEWKGDRPYGSLAELTQPQQLSLRVCVDATDLAPQVKRLRGSRPEKSTRSRL